MIRDWDTSDMKQDGQAEWLSRLGEKCITVFRTIKKVPVPDVDGYLDIEVPTLVEQARALNKLDDYTPGNVVPTGVIKFIP